MTKIFLILSMVLTAIPAIAAEPLSVHTQVVETADLNLADPAGRAALDLRLQRAVKQVCGDASSADLAGRNQVRACRSKTLASARAQATQALAQRQAPSAIRVALAR